MKAVTIGLLLLTLLLWVYAWTSPDVATESTIAAWVTAVAAGVSTEFSPDKERPE